MGNAMTAKRRCAVWEKFYGDTKDPKFTDEDVFLSDVIRFQDGLVSEKPISRISPLSVTASPRWACCML